MVWKIFLILSFLSFVIFPTVGLLHNKRAKRISERKNLTSFFFIGISLSAFFLFIPIYIDFFRDKGGDGNIINVILISVHNAIRLFVIDCDFEIIRNFAADIHGFGGTLYSTFSAVIYIAAPIMTAGFALSFFKNLSAYGKLFIQRNRTFYVFSELNDRSIALAESIVSTKKRKKAIIFTDVFEKDDEHSYEIEQRAKAINAILFKNDITTITFNRFGKKNTKKFFVIGEDENENINHAILLSKEYNDCANCDLFVFSSNIETELLLDKVGRGKIRIRRINDVRALIYRNLYEDGVKIFESAVDNGGKFKEINAVLIGLGKHGTEMLKALTWFCQMDGYTVNIDVFDKDKLAESRFKAQCPELMSDTFNGKYYPDEARYNIRIHSGVDTDTIEFTEKMRSMPETTYVFVALGTDDVNIRTAIRMRILCEQAHSKPTIQAVVYNTDKKLALSGISNFKNENYNIDFIGDEKTCYSEDVVLNSELEQTALRRHLKWSDSETEFYTYDYNYKSSMASAIHLKTRIRMGVPGADKAEEDLTDEERDIIQRLEHRRWSAYMRSEGYIYSGSTDKSTRNDLGKMHHDLVHFDDLSAEEKAKDSQVGTDG